METIDVTDVDEVWLARGTEAEPIDVSEIEGEFISPPGSSVFYEEP